MAGPCRCRSPSHTAWHRPPRGLDRWRPHHGSLGLVCHDGDPGGRRVGVVGSHLCHQRHEHATQRCLRSFDDFARQSRWHRSHDLRGVDVCSHRVLVGRATRCIQWTTLATAAKLGGFNARSPCAPRLPRLHRQQRRGLVVGQRAKHRVPPARRDSPSPRRWTHREREHRSMELSRLDAGSIGRGVHAAGLRFDHRCLGSTGGHRPVRALVPGQRRPQGMAMGGSRRDAGVVAGVVGRPEHRCGGSDPAGVCSSVASRSARRGQHVRFTNTAQTPAAHRSVGQRGVGQPLPRPHVGVAADQHRCCQLRSPRTLRRTLPCCCGRRSVHLHAPQRRHKGQPATPWRGVGHLRSGLGVGPRRLRR